MTIRHDFVHRAIEIPELAELLNLGTLHLAAPSTPALAQMIRRPAELAALELDDGLPEQILSDMSGQAGALALMAYTLDELYKIAETRHDRRLTFADYAALEGVQGAIGKRAEQTFSRLATDDKEALLARVFRELVEVDERGTATRQRCAIGRFDDAELALVRAFTDARLLVVDALTLNPSSKSFAERGTSESLRHEGEGAGDEGIYVEVAHEALFRSWERLRTWIAEAQEDLILLRQVRTAAHDWGTKREREPGKDFDYLRWPAERLKLVNAMLERLKPELNDVERDFIEPEQYRLYRELGFDVHPLEDGLVDVTPGARISETSHPRRYTVGARLNDIGEIRRGIGVINGLPDMLWLPVGGSSGVYRFEFGEFEVKPFFIAKYLTTFAQFQAFIDSGEYGDPRWWEGFPDDCRPQQPENPTNGSANAPRDTITWYQSVALGRWLDAKYLELGLFERFLPSPQTPLPTAPPALGEGLQNLPLKGEYRARASEVLTQIARDLRQRETPAEELLWECLRDRRLAGLKFRRQHPVANTTYVVDFYCYEHRLVIELDGGIHAAQREADALRQADLEASGFRILRLPNDMLYSHLEDVLAIIAQTALEFSPLLASVSERSGEGPGVRANWQIRLPTEWEWQWAAMNGIEERKYPWGEWDEHPRANTTEAGIQDRSTAVGMYPHGAAACGALDMAGNLWEWCANNEGEPEIIDAKNTSSKVLRGGSIINSPSRAAAVVRYSINPNYGYYDVGLRLVLGAPMASLTSGTLNSGSE